MNHPGEPRKETVSQGGGGGDRNLSATAANQTDAYEQTIKEFIPASWFHPVGIFKVLARFWDRLPDVSGKLFLTFTLDPKLYLDEETAFEDSRDWLRKVFYQLRHRVEHEGKTFTIDAPYCIKVEFHESGWVHFHAIFQTRRFLPKELLAGLWDRGWVTVQRIWRWACMGVLRQNGLARTVRFRVSYRDIFDHLVLSAALDGRYKGSGEIIINRKEGLKSWLKTQNNLLKPKN